MSPSTIIARLLAPVAQLDRALGFEPSGREFESLRVRNLMLLPFEKFHHMSVLAFVQARKIFSLFLSADFEKTVGG